MEQTHHRVTIIGSGLAGLMSAYELAEHGIKSLVLSKGPLIQTNTWMAQGGVAAAVSSTDSIQKHMRDTLEAGDGLCVPEHVEKILELGPSLIQKLMESGMKFDFKDNQVSLGKEGGHKQRRILHVDDQTGRALHQFLLQKLQSDDYKDFCDFTSNCMVISAKKDPAGNFQLSLLNHTTQERQNLTCSHLVLATGGAGKAFLYTSNWEGATGDGFKIAHDLGASLTNLEMVQFHPTCLYHAKERNFLISEALRGEGAKLINEKGERFAFKFHEKGELAPRDVVSRAIEHEIKASGKDCVFLDVSHLDDDFLKTRFPTIYSRCLELGVDISKAPIPVIPAAHYTCGGITTNSDLVSTSVKNLFAVGECGYTGLHGANRLASNSLLECLATANLCAVEVAHNIKNETLFLKRTNDLSSIDPEEPQSEDLFLVNALWEEVRTIMWNYVGIQRSTSRLKQALLKIENIEAQIFSALSKAAGRDRSELMNITFFSKFCILSALTRKESRGCHYNIDHPKKSLDLLTTFVQDNKVTLKALKPSNNFKEGYTHD